MVFEERNPFLDYPEIPDSYAFVVYDDDPPNSLLDEFEEDITITTCSGCGMYADHYGPHIGCKYDGEFM